MGLTPSSRGGALAQFAFAALLVILLTAATTAVAGLLQFKQLTLDLGVTPALKDQQVTIADPGKPQTILVVGSDHRFGTAKVTANTDTMLLVRLDPNSSTINVISIPRDLKVRIPEGGIPVTAKLNSAYSVGGTRLLETVLKRDVFTGLTINHVVNVNFGGFEALVDAIGCVYSDIDHRYYNASTLGANNYSSINLQAGYQKLCGADALSFVRFRHTDSDIVRNARQQDFVRWAKDQYGQGALIANRDRLLRIFGAHTQTDANLHSVSGLINLFTLVAFSAGHSIRQVKFPAIQQVCGTPVGGAALQTPCYVTADPATEQSVFRSFLAPTRPTPSPGSSPPPSRPPAPGAPPGARPPGLAPDPIDGKAQAAALANAGMPVYYPRLIPAAAGVQYEALVPGEYPRAYQLHDESAVPHPAYRMVVSVNPALGQYYGIQGTAWQSPPILAHPNETRTVGGKRLALYRNGHLLSVVAWRTPRGVYWISNTLTDGLNNQQMLGIAASLTRAP